MVHLQGRVQFPTGGKVRDPRERLIRCNSETDSIVWYAEDEMLLFALLNFDVNSKVLLFCGEAFFRGSRH